jgi:hypothetical protein
MRLAARDIFPHATRSQLLDIHPGAVHSSRLALSRRRFASVSRLLRGKILRPLSELS